MMRGLAFGVVALFIAACGFRPLYQNTNTLTGDASSLDAISIEEVQPSNSGASLDLKNNLIDRFYHHGYPSNAPYVLKISLGEVGRNIVIQKDNTTTRAQLVLVANYELLDRQTRKQIDHGTMRAVGAYNVLQSQYTTLVTQNSAREAAIRELADKLTLRLAVVLDSGHGQTGPLPPPIVPANVLLNN